MEVALAAPPMTAEEVKRLLQPAAQPGRFSGIVALLLTVMTVFLSAGRAEAICKGSILNPITDVCWQCMFPMSFGGMSFGQGAGGPAGQGTGTTICSCPELKIPLGMTVSFWEHARLNETVKDPYCFPTLGTGMNDGGGLSALLAGSQRGGDAAEFSEYSSQQSHWFIFPVWVWLNLFTDFPCIEKKPFDVAYMTEVDPLWNDDALSFVINPEALLFGNPITQLSCVADTVAATTGLPINEMFWCHGAWGSPYPLSGSKADSLSLSTNAGLAARTIFKLGREGILFDTGIEECATGGIMTPIMRKNNYRFQVARPVRGNDCVPVGRPTMLWGQGKNPALGAGRNSSDNFLWVTTRARKCCVGYSVKY